MPQPRGWPIRGRRPWGLAARGFAAAAVLLVAGSTAAAQTLTEALAYAYRNNPELLAQRAALRATDEEVPQALSGWRPTVTYERRGRVQPCGSDHEQRNNRKRERRNMAQLCEPLGAARSAAQPIYRGGRTEAADPAGDQHRAGRPRADPGGRDRGFQPRSPPPSSRGARPESGRGCPQQRAGSAQAAGGDARPVPGRRGDPDRCGAGRGRPGAGDRAADSQPRAISRPAGRFTPGRSDIRLDGCSCRPSVPALPATREEALALAATNNSA